MIKTLFSTVLISAVFNISNLNASPLALNPLNLPISGIEFTSVPKELETAWLQSFLREFVRASPSFSEVRSSSLSELIRQATENFLESKLEEANEHVEEALKIVSSTPPSSVLRQNLIEVISLKFMISTAIDPAAVSIPEEVLPFADDREFISKLPSPLQKRVRQIKMIQYPLEGSYRYSQLLNGQMLTQIPNGRYLAHRFENHEITTEWVDFARGRRTSTTPLWKKSIWAAYPIRNLIPILERTRPPILAKAQIRLVYRDAQSRIETASLRELDLERTGAKPISGFLDQIALTKETPKDSSRSIFKSPWFWVASMAIAGTAGYFIYEASRSPTLKSP